MNNPRNPVPPSTSSPSRSAGTENRAGVSLVDAPEQERRRRPRLSLTGEQFRLSAQNKVYAVVDLSADGMAVRVLDREDLRHYPVAGEIAGELNLRGARFPVRGRVANIRGELVGCEFTDLSTEARASLERALDPEALGRELRAIPVSTDGTNWFHGPGGADLLLSHERDGECTRVTAFLLGSYVQWDGEAGLRTGRARNAADQPESWGIVRLETMILERDPQPDAQKLSIAKALVLSSNLPEELKRWCVGKLDFDQRR